MNKDQHSEGNAQQRTSEELRLFVQDILKHGFVDDRNNEKQFQLAMRRRESVNAVLEPLDLVMNVDEFRRLAFLQVLENEDEEQDTDEWSHPLVRRQRLTLEQSLLVAILRRFYLLHEQEVGTGISDVKVPLEDIQPELVNYLGESGSDAKDEARLHTLFNQLKPHGIVTEPDNNQEVTVRPMIVHLVNPETLSQLIRQYSETAEENEPTAEES